MSCFVHFETVDGNGDQKEFSNIEDAQAFIDETEAMGFGASMMTEFVVYHAETESEYNNGVGTRVGTLSAVSEYDAKYWAAERYPELNYGYFFFVPQE